MGDAITLFLGGVLGFLASLLANVVTGPVLSLASRYRLVLALSRIPLTSDKRLRGNWRIAWSVRSRGYPPVNEGVTKISSFLGAIGFSATSSGYGTQRVYLYVGYATGSIISGRWYDPDGTEAYHGLFQIRLNGALQSAHGKWIGWAADGTVKAGNLTLERQPCLHG